MKKCFQLLTFAIFMVPALLKANEGMWLVSLLNKMNEAEMKGLGLNLTKEEIYSINNASLKDAIVRLNYGMCTGEIVSEKGLIFTNHHCAFDAIQTLSTVENNMLVNGFCAKSINEELPIPDFKIQFLVRIDDVTKDVLSAVTAGMSEADRDKAIAAKSKELSMAANENGRYEVEVKSFYYGNEFYMIVYETFSDIRLVGNPPESVGKFGGDTDNWMWPRHTGDFSMLRVYADKDNKPAAYSKDNVPYKPKHFLPVNIDGVEEGDFTMIMGFPGRTSRYLTSWGIEQAVGVRNPALIECLGTKLESWKLVMDKEPRVDLMYAAKYASTANGWKYYIGQNKGLIRNDVKADKMKVEKEFTSWVNQNDDRKKKYGNTLNLIRDYYSEWDPFVKASTYSSLCGAGGAEFMGFAAEMGEVLKQLSAEKDEAKRREMINAIMPDVDAHFKEYDAATDKVAFINLTNLYRSRINADRPTWHSTLDSKYKGDVKLYADKLFMTSIFTDKDRLVKFMQKPNAKAIDRDLAYLAASSSMEHAMAFRPKNPVAKFNEGMRLLTAGLREMNPSKAYAPDANSTMRLTYGTVNDYKPADAVHYDFYTTTNGIMEKRDNSNPEFVVPDALADLITKKDFGRYANKKGELVTCFIHDLDITGGNSGSPVIDGDGNIIGIAFDGNWEAMSGDIAFEPELQRTISVDIRYVLFTVEKLMGGKNIIDELKFAKKKPKPIAAPADASSSANPTTTGNATPGAVTTGGGSKTDAQKRMEDQKTKMEEVNKQKKEEFEKKKKEAEKQREEAKKKTEQNKVAPAKTGSKK